MKSRQDARKGNAGARGAVPKTTRPSASRVFKRERPLKLLDEGLGARSVWVCGPPGAGKTSLVSSFIERRDIPCIWYQVDEGDGDIATFFSYLGAAAAREAPRGKKSLPHFGPERMPGLSSFAREYFRSLFSILPRPVVMVFDNFQEVNPESKFYDVLRDGIAEAPQGCAFILISRNEVPSVFMRLRANREMRVIGWDDLRLTRDELKGITRFMGHRLGDEAAGELLQRTGGWIAGLLLMLEHGKDCASREQGFDRADVRTVFNYFMGEILEKSDAETRGFLLSTGHLPSMTVKMAGDLTDAAHADGILSRLNSGHFFIERRALAEDVYQYHPLFREFLLRYAGESLEPGRLAAIKKRAAGILSDAGRAEDSARLFIESGDWESLKDLILGNAKAFMAESRTRTIEDWLNALPERAVQREPWLMYYLGLCRLPINPAEARVPLEASFRAFKSLDDASGSFMAWSGVVDTYLYEWMDFRPLDHWIREFEGLMEKHGGFPSPETEGRAASCFFSALLFHQPLHPDLPEWAGRINAMIQGTRDFVRKMSLSRNLILYYLWTGRVTRAGALIESLSYGYKSDSEPLTQLMYLRSLAVYHFYAGAYKAALEVIDEALRLADRFGIHLLDAMLRGQGVYSAVSIGEIDTAEGFLEKIARSLDKVRCYDVIQYHHQASFVALHRDDRGSAIEHARLCLQLTEGKEAPILENVHRFTLFSIMVGSGEHRRQPERVGSLIAEVRKFGQDFKSALFEYACLYMEAVVAMDEGREKECLERLGRVFEICREHGLRCQPFIRPQSFVRLFSIALKAGLETELVTELINLHALVPDESAAMTDEWPRPVRVNTLGRFEILIEGRRVEFSRKAQKKPVDVLKALIAFGGQNVPEERITDALWPDSEGDMASQAFATTLHRLRKLLGHDRALVYRDGHLSLDRRFCRVDAYVFESLLKDSAASLKRDEAMSLAEKALVLYRGDFLSGDENEEWAISMRERLRMRLLKCIERAGRRLEESGRFAPAAELYNRALEADDLSEYFYQRLMVCYCKTDKRSEALKTYNRCRTLLSSRLGIEPSSETEAIFLKISKP